MSTPASPRVLSGIQPTSDSYHLGNYLGAVRGWVELGRRYDDSLYFIPDMHAITVPQDPADLRERTYRGVAQLIAAGVDPARSAIYVQSHVAEHAQLAWVLNCVASFGEMSRMTQFKDKSAKGGADASTVGLFTYPALMAADILLYQADLVPTGEDQRQHIELTRNLAQRFNNRYGQTFVVPEPLIGADAAKIYDLQNPTAKMSKSAESPAGLVQILDAPKVSAKKIRSAVTDNDAVIAYDRQAKPGVSNLLTINAALTARRVEDVVAAFEGKGYGHLKVETADALEAEVAPIRTRFDELMADRGELRRILADGAARVRPIAAKTLADVYEKVGFVPGR